MEKREQKMRFSDVELALIKGLFAGNDELLYAVRKVMLQGDLLVGEQVVLKKAMNDQTWAVIKKMFHPDMDPSAPIGQVSHLALGLGAETKGLSPEGAWPFIQAKSLEIKYLSQQLEVLKDLAMATPIKLTELLNIDVSEHEKEAAYVNLLAWNFLLQWIDSCVFQFKVLAGLKEETVEQTLKRLAKDSNK